MQSTQNKKQFKKGDVNRKSSILFTQLGLVLALLLVYIAIESKTLVNHDVVEYVPPTTLDIDDPIPDTTPEEVKQKEPKLKANPELILDDPEIIKDDSGITETIIDVSKMDPENPVYSIYEEVNIKEEVIEDVAIIIVEEMPIFPGCKGTREELKACLSKGIGSVIKKNFNPDIAQDIGLASGVQRIFVMFIIDKNGNISNIKSNAPHKSLEKETIRVLKKIPKIKPGIFKGKKVGVKYSLPINYLVLD